MFSERELLILQTLVDMAITNRPAGFWAHVETDQLGHKIHRVLQATRRMEGDPSPELIKAAQAQWAREAKERS
jgi:hypothetical protein